MKYLGEFHCVYCKKKQGFVFDQAMPTKYGTSCVKVTNELEVLKECIHCKQDVGVFIQKINGETGFNVTPFEIH